jgi:hypothetical protein
VSVRTRSFPNLNDWASSLALAAQCRGLAFPPSALPLALRRRGKDAEDPFQGRGRKAAPFGPSPLSSPRLPEERPAGRAPGCPTGLIASNAEYGIAIQRVYAVCGAGPASAGVHDSTGIPAQPMHLCAAGSCREGISQQFDQEITCRDPSASLRGNLRTETLDYQISTEAKHFAIGSLPAPISITSSFKDPGALPDIRKLAVRGGAAAGLGVLFPPAAILPTIQFGVGDDHRCEALARRGK